MLGTLATQLLLFDNPFSEKVFEKILTDEGFVLNKKNNLIIRDFKRADGESSVLFVINPGKEKASDSYEFDGNFLFVDNYDNENFKFSVSQNKLEFEIGPEDAACIIYKNI